jgi:hypothetical protein
MDPSDGPIPRLNRLGCTRSRSRGWMASVCWLFYQGPGRGLHQIRHGLSGGLSLASSLVDDERLAVSVQCAKAALSSLALGAEER